MTPIISPLCPVPGCGAPCYRINDSRYDYHGTINCEICSYRAPTPAAHEQICRAMNRDNHAQAVKIFVALATAGIQVMEVFHSKKNVVAIIEAVLEGRKGGE